MEHPDAIRSENRSVAVGRRVTLLEVAVGVLSTRPALTRNRRLRIFIQTSVDIGTAIEEQIARRPRHSVGPGAADVSLLVARDPVRMSSRLKARNRRRWRGSAEYSASHAHFSASAPGTDVRAESTRFSRGRQGSAPRLPTKVDEEPSCVCWSRRAPLTGARGGPHVVL
jgi:hypothetical protein